MRRANKMVFGLLWVVFWLVSLSCNLPVTLPESSSGDDTGTAAIYQPGESIEIQTSEPIVMAQGVLGETGGVVRIDDPGGALDGFQIEAPAGAWAEEVSVTVRAAEVTLDNLDSDLRIASPLISVEVSSSTNQGELAADDFMQVRLPRNSAPDTFAMFFIYDEASGTLDALPLLSQDETHLTALTRHFSKLVVLEAEKPALDKLNLKTGFVQGVNNWQFTNRGSYISPGGHCAGQIMSAMYYFDMTGGEPLYGTYDAANNNHPPTPGFDFDDRLGYRLASVTQKKANWDDEMRNYWVRLQRNDDEMTYYSFALALRASNLPQYVSVKREGGGHALILYEKYGDRFYVSDPNHPAASARRAIVYDRNAKKFKPYFGGATADVPQQAYPQVYYINRNWLLSEAQFDALWAQFTDGTIGDDYFPNYYLWQQPDVPVPDLLQFKIKDPYHVTSDSIRVMLVGQDGMTSRVKIYNSGLNLLFTRNNRQLATLPITAGKTQYFFVVSGVVNDRWRYIDGRWITFVQNYTGSWNSGPVCGEVFETRYRWQVSLMQDEAGTIAGTIHFHDCPGGGQSAYHVTGSLPENQSTLTLQGVKVGGAGDLYENTPLSPTFTIVRNAPPQPNLAP